MALPVGLDADMIAMVAATARCTVTVVWCKQIGRSQAEFAVAAQRAALREAEEASLPVQAAPEGLRIFRVCWLFSFCRIWADMVKVLYADQQIGIPE